MKTEEPDPRVGLFADWCRLVWMIDQDRKLGGAPGDHPSWSFYRDRREGGTWDDYVQGQARWSGDERYTVAGHSDLESSTKG